jgi:pimeloyl-ACP methyl ester carboxylesterase
MVAEALAAAGIASLRYDKRGIGASASTAGNEADLRFTTFADDAASLIRMLQGDKRFSKVVVIGHSEGALLGTMAARQADADGVILLSGAGRPIADVIREQLKTGAPHLAEPAERIIVELLAGRTVADVPASLNMLFRPSAQPYMISWLPVDPSAELARLRVPRLVIHGTTDVQTSVADARRLAEAESVRLEIIDGMNHVLKRVSGTPQEQMGSYSDPSLPLVDELMPIIVRFIEALR